MKRALAAVAVPCALVLAGCGGSSHTTTTVKLAPKAAVAPTAPVVPVKVVSSHVCDKKDYSMGCALPVASVADIARGVDPVTQGVDFAWSCPLSSARNFGASYVSYDTSKNWTRACVDQFHAAHKGTVAVWEAGASDATGGYSLGESQAREAAKQVAALGAGPHQPLLLAIDCDCAGSTLVSYFQGANHAEPGRIDAYGGYDQISYLYSHHLVGHVNWQTYAWSGGRWLPASVAPLEQYLNSSSVDYDRAIAAYYGQWPNNTAPAPKPKPKKPSGPHCFTKHPDTKNATCKRVRHEVNVLWSDLHTSIRNAHHRGCVLVYVRRHGTYRLEVGLKTGKLCKLIGGNAARERRTIDTTTTRYR